MILAEKIIELRKKNGWSQEELAEKLHVSRQAVSKWEEAQSVPDLNKIISMADIFGVSTDYLLKEELETEQYVEKTYSESREGAEEKAVRWVSLEESNTFLEVNRKAAGKIAAGVMMCILSPILAVLLSCAGSVGYLSISEDQGGVIGAILIMIVIAGAVALFVSSGMSLSKYAYLEKEYTETEYGVSGMVKERKNGYEAQHTRELVFGILLCVISVVPVLACALANENNDFVMAVGTSLFLAIVAVGVCMIVKTSIIWDGYQKLLEEGEYTREKKSINRDSVLVIFWCTVTAIYLGYSLYTFDWGRSWIIWPVAAMLSAAIAELRKERLRKKKDR